LKDQPHHFARTAATLQLVVLLAFAQQLQNQQELLSTPRPQLLHQLPCCWTMMHLNCQMQKVLENPSVLVELVLAVTGTALWNLLHSEAANEGEAHTQHFPHICS
jgi:hypothetical protein